MATDIADYGADAYLNLIYNGVALPALYVALLINDADKGFDGTILATVEVPLVDETATATGYARMAVPAWSVPEGGFLTSAEIMDYGTATADWGIVSSWALVDATSGGNLYAYGDFSAPQYVGSGNAFQIPSGGLTVTLAGPAAGIVV